MAQKLPIGIQGFIGLRNDEYLYVDKTEYIYRLKQSGKQFFLSRPRRFGKSLLISAMKAYWEGRKDLFNGLKIAELESSNHDAWKKYPVFCFDFNGQNYKTEGALESILDEYLRRWETEYSISASNASIGERFRNLLIKAKDNTGLRCVVLVDEYDSPIIDSIENAELASEKRNAMRSFYTTIKSKFANIRYTIRQSNVLQFFLIHCLSNYFNTIETIIFCTSISLKSRNSFFSFSIYSKYSSSNSCVIIISFSHILLTIRQNLIFYILSWPQRQ